MVRAARLEDLEFAQQMLYEAANRPGEPWPALAESINEPRNVRFWHNWLREGDVAVVGEVDGRQVGAAWIRHFTGDELGPFDDPAVPVLAVGVQADWRGRGVGGLLMRTLLDAAHERGVGCIDLTTGTSNEAAVRLYRSCGFAETARVDDAIRMRVALSD